MDVHGRPRAPTDTHGRQGAATAAHGCPRAPTVAHGHRQMPTVAILGVHNTSLTTVCRINVVRRGSVRGREAIMQPATGTKRDHAKIRTHMFFCPNPTSDIQISQSFLPTHTFSDTLRLTSIPPSFPEAKSRDPLVVFLPQQHQGLSARHAYRAVEATPEPAE